MFRAVVIVAALGPLLLTGCASDGSYAANPFAPPPPPKPAAPAFDMAGRWTLASPEGGFCGMTFSSNPGASEGTIAPEGGCPGQFYTSRHWTADPTGVTILNHKEEPLVHLAASNPGGRFEGRAASGITVILTR